MTAIVLDKTWVVTKVETSVNAVATDSKNLLLGIKNAFKANGWSVAYSCDAVNVDVTDLWTTTAAITWPSSGDHSWIVLTNSNISANFSICLECLGANTAVLKMYCSTSAYNSDGTKTTKPTSSGTEVTVLNGAWKSSTNAANTTALVFSSSDYTCTRVYITDTSKGHGLWILDVPKNPASYWTTPYVALASVYNTSYSNFLFSQYCALSDPKVRTNIGATTVTLTCGSIGSPSPFSPPYGESSQGYGSNFDGSFVLLPVFLISLTSASPGLYGQLFDLCWSNLCFEIQKKANPCGYLPSSTSNFGFIIFGCFALGNDGSIHPITV